MKRMGKMILTLAALPLMAAWTCAGAADGTLEINQDCAADGCFPGDTPGSPITLPASGRYKLTSDLSGLFIQFGPGALDVDLNLGGFTLDGGVRCTGSPVTSCTLGGPLAGISMPNLASGYYLAHIHDGTLRGFQSAIYGGSLAGGSSFEHLLITENNNIAAACNLDLGEPGSTLYVRHSRFVRNRSDGLKPNTNAGSTPIRLVVEDSEFSANGNAGLTLFVGSIVLRNTFTDNAGSGFQCAGAVGAGGATASAAGGNVFFNNRPTLANSEYSCPLRDMGGNVCQDGACP
ncbi:MAG: hypothetical protein ABI411_20850 [Tahibacter sp.]